MKIISLEAENFKRLRAVEITPDGNTVVISGKNAQGKTSVLDAIWAALGGREGNAAVKPIREGAETATVRVDLGDMIVTRKWTAKGSTVRVENSEGAEYKSPQTLLDGFIGKLTFDPLAFTRLSVADQRKALLGLVELPIDLDALDAERAELFATRTNVGRDGKNLGAEPAVDEGLPVDEVSASTLLGEIRAAQDLARQHEASTRAVADRARDIEADQAEIARLQERINTARAELESAAKAKADLPAVPDVEALESKLAGVEESNARIRENNTARAKVGEIKAKRDEYKNLTSRIEALDAQKVQALASAEFPVPGLGFDENGVTFNSIPFAQASSAEQIRVSLAIAIAMNPGLKVIRILDGSLLDEDGMRLVDEVAVANDYQVWIERVGDAGAVGIVIEDGMVKA